MILSIAATLLLACLAMAPGWVLVRGRAQRPGMAAAAMAASLTVVMLVTALLGIATKAVAGLSLPALSLIAVGIVATAGAQLGARRIAVGASTPRSAPVFEWQGLALGVIFLAYGFFVHWLAVREGPGGALLVHGWYNADWFKHLGHVSAIANFGVPAVDNFNRADPLYYYWLSYVLPAAGLAIGNDGWSALAAANSVLVLLFGSVFYGVLRQTGAARNIALLIGVIALFASAPTSFLYQLVAGIGLDGILNFPAAPKGPGLMTLSQYIPQHLLAIVALLGWFLLKDDGRLRWLALAALVPVMAISVLLGAVVLLAYGLYRLWSGRLQAVPELVAMVILSGLIVVVFQVVQIGNVDSAIESPLLVNERPDLPLMTRIIASVNLVLGTVGVPFLIAVLGLYYWRPSESAKIEVKGFAVALIAAALLAAVAVEIVMTERLAIETRIRAVNLPALANAIIGVFLFDRVWRVGGRQRALGVAVLIAVVLVALPSAGLRTAWHGRMGDSFTTEIPRDDRAVLAAMRERTAKTAIVLQYPEPPVLAPDRGDDAWAAIIGQRAVTASLRATDYPLAKPRIEAAERFFAGAPEPIAPEVDLVYLSRVLHPDSYAAVLARMDAEPGFERLACYADACLFQRRESSRP
ncbi:hypothetical protein [Erythrobacter sp. JK5]|uniref:hypothetical protein n=1 Tax=Erythrobacter sp. JK5 TaxID=2829500 RepID=UPI001BAA3007|nr:hypothetical protein [Erythrobacter sp. JK5]QUL39273.1 hypothetical protein KDC96_08200 [Erythrobacter sp. JK5]